MAPNRLFLTAAFLGLGSPVFSINPPKVLRFPFDPGAITLTAEQKNFADSVYNYTKPGSKVYFNLLNESEESLGEMERAKLTFKRAEAILSFCHTKKYGPKEYYAEITPYNAPQKIRTNDLQPASYRSYSSKKAVTAMVFSPVERAVTSKSCTKFDASTSQEKQAFTFNPREEIAATLQSGTKITIPASSLVFVNGGHAPTEPISLEVAEYKEMDAIIMKAMTTRCGNKNLQTGGMWHISASCKGQALMMKPGQHYHIEVANNGPVKNMQVFTGEMRNGVLDWKLQDDGSVSSGNGSANVLAEDNKAQVKSEAIEKVNVINAATDELVLNDISSRNWNDNRNNIRVNETSGLVLDASTIQDGVYAKAGVPVYDLKLNDFGWINCDAFDPETQKMTELVVSGDISDKSNVILVYPGRKSVLPGYLCQDGKSVKFQNIAADETAIVVVITPTDDKDKVERFTAVVNPGKQQNVTAKTTKVDIATLQKELKGKLSDI